MFRKISRLVRGAMFIKISRLVRGAMFILAELLMFIDK